MAQHDYTIDNASGAVVRADLNDVLEAIATNNSGVAAPSPTFQNQWWFDSGNNQLKIRNDANTAWIIVAEKSGNSWTPYYQGVIAGDAITRDAAAGSGDLLPTDGDGSGLSGLPVLVAAGTVSAGAALNLTGLTTAYAAYKLVFWNLAPATNDTAIWVRVSDNGSTYDEGASDYAWSHNTVRAESGTGTNIPSGDDADSKIVIAGGVGTGTGEDVAGEIMIYAPAQSGVRTRITFQLYYLNQGGAQFDARFGGGLRLAAQTDEAVRLLFSSGNIATMSYALFGYPAS